MNTATQTTAVPTKPCDYPDCVVVNRLRKENMAMATVAAASVFLSVSFILWASYREGYVAELEAKNQVLRTQLQMASKMMEAVYYVSNSESQQKRH